MYFALTSLITVSFSPPIDSPQQSPLYDHVILLLLLLLLLGLHSTNAGSFSLSHALSRVEGAALFSVTKDGLQRPGMQ
jgi:hypothetical protein